MTKGGQKMTKIWPKSDKFYSKNEKTLQILQLKWQKWQKEQKSTMQKIYNQAEKVKKPMPQKARMSWEKITKYIV